MPSPSRKGATARRALAEIRMVCDGRFGYEETDKKEDIGEVLFHTAMPAQEDDKRRFDVPIRIVECWNAMQGLSIKDVHQIAESPKIRKAIKELLKGQS